MTDKYIDPNSGAAPQPGGYAHAPVELPDSEKSESEERDATYDAAVEHEAAPAGDQPAPQNDGDTANEAGATDEATTGDGGVPESTQEDAPAEGDGGGEGEPAKDYSELLNQSLGPIQEYLDAHPDELEAVQAAEIDRAGDDARKGVIEYEPTPSA